ncbi:unnamed protein product [Zymoseptoria tritici ST99CH_3D1]|nr:unnamed protein product [Zymoseptoria tritici ST99CH_3D1]
MESSPSSSSSSSSKRPLLSTLKLRANNLHASTPYLRRLPAPALFIVLLLILTQLLVWTCVGIVLSFHPLLVSTSILSYTLGLRHALDADHISAIDLMTRRLVASGQKPVTVGTFFSLGHSTIVIITSIVVAASSAAIESRFGAFGEVGSIIGSSISAAFLLILGGINIYILHRLLIHLRSAIAAPAGQDFALDITFTGGTGCMTALLHRCFNLIDRPWKMYPLGVLFGLGFDTSSEIALLGLSSIQAAKGTSIWLILIFPILFTSGMCLLDTLDGAAMMSLYTSARLAKDAIAVLYYQCVLTGITVAVAVAIGTLQLLTMIRNVRPEWEGGFWDGVDVAGEHYDVIGGAICGAFLVGGVLAVGVYRPWRRRVEREREKRGLGGEDEAEGEGGEDGESAVGERCEGGGHGVVEAVVGGTKTAATTAEEVAGKKGVRTEVRVVGESSRDAAELL